MQDQQAQMAGLHRQENYTLYLCKMVLHHCSLRQEVMEALAAVNRIQQKQVH
jgi:hypothetical protein